MTRRPRITVSIDQDQYDVLQRLGRARGVSVGKLVRELVEAVEPALGRAASLLEQAARAQAELPRKLRELTNVGADDMEALGEMADLVELLELVRAAGAKEGGPGVNPRPVTRGLGRPDGEGGTAERFLPNGVRW